MTADTPAHVLVCANTHRHGGSLGNVTTNVVMIDHFGTHLDQLHLYLKLFLRLQTCT